MRNSPPSAPLVTQVAFAAAVTDPDRAVPAGLAAWNGGVPERRFAVYRNNVTVSLMEALGARYPAVRAIVGADFFAAMARLYVAAHPPRSPLMMVYGEDFADFLAGFEPAESLPYLPDIARLEAARSRAYHAADAAPLDPAGLAGLSPEAIAALRLAPHPAFALIRSVHPVVTIWAMNEGEREPGPIEPWEGEDALVTRPHLDVAVHRLPPGAGAFIAALAEGAPLRDAAGHGLAAAPEFDLSAALALVLASGAFTGAIDD
ncbi:putative DNA-binding domain-containing protein [Ancylobacter sp. VKM B-3255]|uniref:DNA-binding domain-containing protein n=2 Tax=Ancylobacter radicis TaxID=2836179 RepID=A0ABS5R5R7_9HYPH|nr:DNA-binding domain-containing protein [Ancylobacter radicis]MBS9477015.1 putative DNA-binding domain-containing protein [Ancylobacter radicis]